MMRWIIRSSLKFRFLVIAFAGAMMYFGLGQLRDMPVDVFPEFAPPIIEIQTPTVGLTAAEVESLVTVPLEDALNGIPGLDVMRSQSVPDLSSIELVLQPGTDLLRARQLVQERLTTVTPTLPTWASPPFMMPPKSATSRVMMIGLSSDEIPLIEMSTIAYWKIRQRLLRVPGVVNVAIWGERLQQLHVRVDPKKMQQRNVSLEHVMEVTSKATDAGLLRFSTGALIGTGGFIETPNQRIGIQHVLPVITPEQLAQVPLQKGSGDTRIGHVANVLEGSMPLIGDAVINDGPGLLLVVEKFPGANTLEVTRGVESALDKLRPGLPGITMDSTIFRPATFIEMAIHNLAIALLIGCALVVLVLFSFLYEWRTALISLVAIPLSLVAAVLVLDVRGATINTMVLAGLVVAVGVVVDDAIIDVENILRRLRLRRAHGDDISTARVILDASMEVRTAIFYATLINVLAVVPVFFMESLAGAFFKPLAMSYALAVLVSMVVALTVTPALGLILLSRAPLDRPESPLVRWLQRGYRASLERIVDKPLPSLVAVGLIFVMGIAVWPRLGESLFPAFKERDFLMHWVSKPGTSLPEER
ncbi:MAG TPA: efflux RND transporter permease subunit, partial [Actinomycetota bacterium]|nr:efflux RND transporter permease subunit [Actinomycetota bacterium]